MTQAFFRALATKRPRKGAIQHSDHDGPFKSKMRAASGPLRPARLLKPGTQ